MASKAYTKENIAKKRRDWEKYNKGTEKEATPKQLKNIEKNETPEEKLIKRPEEKPIEKTPKTIELNQPQDKIIELNQPEEPFSWKKAAGAAAIGAGVGLAIGAAIPVTATATTISLGASSIAAIRTGIQNRAIVGKIAEMGIKNIGVVERFAVNPKTIGLTTSWVSKIGATTAVAGTLIGIIGSYPFAGFIKEESLQTLGFAFNTAYNAGDMEGAQLAVDETNELLDPTLWKKIFTTIPFANVWAELKDFYVAAATKNKISQEAINIKKAEQSGERETEFAAERRMSDEAAFERKREFGEEETKRFGDIAAKNKADDLEEMQWKSEYYALIREGKFEEADTLLQTRS